MAKKPTIASISSGYQGTATLNDDLQALRDAFDNTLSLDGSTPNAMEADLDLNSNDILNAGTVNASNIVVGGISLSAQVALAEDAADDAIAAASLAGTSSITAQQAATDSINFANDVTFTATTLSPGSSATTSYNSSTLTVTLGIPTGATGATGTKWYSGTGAPSGDTGIVGDWYLDDAGGNVYEKTDASTWTLRDNLTGPSGAGTGDMVKATYDTDNDGIVDAAETVPWAGVSSKPTTISGYGITDAYTESEVDTLLSGKANTSHTHTASDVTDFSEAVDDRVNSLLVAGTNITLTYNDASNSLTIDSTGGTSSGALLRAPQILLSGTTYTSPAGCNTIYVELVGGGGGSGGIDTSTDNVDAGTGGGGSGAYAAKYFTVTPSTEYTYAIGAGGTAGNTSPTNGGTGGSTTFTVGATTVTAAGGVGSTRILDSANATAGGAGGAATNGDINITGNGGASGAGYGAGGVGGAGGNSFFGGGAAGTVKTDEGVTAGIAGTSGGGASGAAVETGTSTRTGNGAAGGAGLIRVWEYS